MNRTLAVTRVQALDLDQAFWPWAIVASALVINMALWVAFDSMAGYQKTTGGLAALYITAGIVAALSVVQMMPLTLGLGAARRTFALGTLLYGLGFSVASALLLVILNRLEDATGGFGLGGSFFRIAWLTDVPTYQLVAVYGVPLVLVLMLGAMFGGILLRFGSTGLFASLVGIALGCTAAIVTISALHAWPSIGSWLGGLTPMTLTAWLLVPTLGAAVASWGLLRRAPV